jgi:hypothetical protein
MPKKAKIITICGSSKYVEVMAAVGWMLERDEKAMVLNLHLLPWWYDTECQDHVAEHEGVADEMDALHLKKIEISDEIFVVNWGGYIGESTGKEIEHAANLGIPIRYITEEDAIRLAIGEMLENATANT